MTWPVKGGDMSPIENVWAIMVKRLNSEKFKNVNEFWLKIKEIWQNISDDKLIYLNLYNSLPTRMKAVEEATGLFTKY